MSAFFGYIGPAAHLRGLDIDAVRRTLQRMGRGGVAFSTSRERESGFLCTFVEWREGVDRCAQRPESVLVGFDGPDRLRAEAIFATESVPDLQGLATLRGGFALAAWCAGKGTLVLARDRSGQRALYYTRVGAGIVFSTSIRVLLASGVVDRRVSWTGLAGFLHFGAVPDDQSLIAGVVPVPAGYQLVYRAGSIEPSVRPIADTAASAAILRESLAASVRQSEVVALLDLAGTGPCSEVSGILGEAGVSGIVNVCMGEGGGKQVDGVETRTVSAVGLEPEAVVHGVLSSFDHPCADGISSWLLAREAAAAGATIALSTFARPDASPSEAGSPWGFNDFMRRIAMRVSRGRAARPIFLVADVDRLIGPPLDADRDHPSSLVDDEAPASAPSYAALPQMTAAHGLRYGAPRAETGVAGGPWPVDPGPGQVPLAQWLGGPLADEAREHVFGLSHDGILAGDPLRRLWRRFRNEPNPANTRKVWALVALGSWISRHEVRA